MYADKPEDTKDSDFIIITAGRTERPGKTRLVLFVDNVRIIKEISEDIARYSKDSLVINITNPVDVLAYFIWKFSGSYFQSVWHRHNT
ncbi:hypothetical protein QQE94_06705 [Fervidobacterium pennivorans subsp. shakshaketiis]